MGNWSKVEELFHAALDQPPAKRAKFLEQASPDDPQLRHEVQQLLDRVVPDDGFLEGSPLSSIMAPPAGLSLGKTIGRFQIISLIGTGGMGEVYRAKDERLQRDVALKVLTPAFALDRDWMRRFEQEARAAGMLNHPNILAIYDIGIEDGRMYVVSELLEGDTLRQRLASGPVSMQEAVDWAIQTAQGLGAAHQKGVVHRDLKPDNLFLTRGGRVKILDFGIAKIVQTPADVNSLDTKPGTVMGTAAYMSPEQVRGEAVDQRSDIFSFGVVLYELVAGKRPFEGESKLEIMNGILKAEPDLMALEIRPALDRVVRHCLEKDPDRRFQAAQDLAFALESAMNPSGTVRDARAPQRSRTAMWVPALAFTLALCAAGFWFGFVRGETSGRQAIPVYHRLTYRRGNIGVARFTADGHTVVYTAAWENNPPELFSSRVDSNESRPLGIDARDVVAISSSGELIVRRRNQLMARVPLAGGAPRDFAERSVIADWAPDGETIAIVTSAKGENRIQYPVGRLLAATTNVVRGIRFSPKGDMLAVTEIPPNNPSKGLIALIDLNGRHRILAEAGRRPEIAWTPDGKEIWFSAGSGGSPRTLNSVDLAGRSRLVARMPGALSLQDISRDGVVLAENDTSRISLMCKGPGESKERDLSWLDYSVINQLSADGRMLLFTEAGEGGGATSSIYLRGVDGSPAVRLGEGTAKAMSPDGKWVLATLGFPVQLVLLPTGVGETRALPRGNIETIGKAVWFSGGDRILFSGSEPGHDFQLFTQDISGGGPQAISPEGTAFGPLSPDGKSIAILSGDGKLVLFSVTGGKSRPVPLDEPDWSPLNWTSDGKSLFISKNVDNVVWIERLNLDTGRREPWKKISPLDPDTLSPIPDLEITPDGQTYAYSYSRTVSVLYLIRGLQ